MKRTLHKRAGLWELSVPLRAPVRGVWRYATFAEAWGYLWRAGYPPGLPSEIKMAAGSAEPAHPGVEQLPDIDDAAHNGSDEPRPARASSWTWRLLAVGLAVALTILLVIVFRPTSRRNPVADAAIPTAAPVAAPITPKPVEGPVADPVTSRASIRTNDRSWITACVDGEVVFSKLFTAGSKYDVDFTEYAVVRMGDAGPVEITLDGKPVGSLGRAGQVRVIELVRGAPHFLVGGEANDCTLSRSR
jgi:Domain of unknown function (DUF4115)